MCRPYAGVPITPRADSSDGYPCSAPVPLWLSEACLSSLVNVPVGNTDLVAVLCELAGQLVRYYHGAVFSTRAPDTYRQMILSFELVERDQRCLLYTSDAADDLSYVGLV